MLTRHFEVSAREMKKVCWPILLRQTLDIPRLSSRLILKSFSQSKLSFLGLLLKSKMFDKTVVNYKYSKRMATRLLFIKPWTKRERGLIMLLYLSTWHSIINIGTNQLAVLQRYWVQVHKVRHKMFLQLHFDFHHKSLQEVLQRKFFGDLCGGLWKMDILYVRNLY